MMKTNNKHNNWW